MIAVKNIKLGEPKMNPEDNLSEPIETNTEPHQPQQFGVLPPEPPKKRFRFLPRPDFMFPKRLKNKLGKFSIPLGLVLVLAFIGGSSLFAYNKFWKDAPMIEAISHFASVEVPFTLVNTTPENFSESANVTEPITFNFSKAASLESFQANFFTEPLIEGTFAYGDSESQIIFTPLVPMDEGANFTIKLDQQVTSLSGEQLGADIEINFITKMASDGVNFHTDYSYASLYSLVPDEEVTFSMYVGDGVDENGKVSIYAADTDKLLSSFVYGEKKSEYDGYTYTYQELLNSNVDIDGEEALATTDGLNNDTTFNFKQPAGVYVIVAATGAKQYGHAWVVVSDKGLLVEQDDQKLIASAKNLSDNSMASGEFTIYSLENRAEKITSFEVTNPIDELEVNYDDNADIVVGTIGEQAVVTPLNTLYSLAHIRSDSDFSKTYRASLITDKPAYKVGDTIEFSGFIRTDNDAAYEIPMPDTVTLIGKSYQYDDTPSFKMDVSIDEFGRFGGQTNIESDWLDEDEAGYSIHSKHLQGNQISVYIDDESEFDSYAGSFVIQKDAASTSVLQVNFDKPSYIANETVTAKISGKKSDGSPLANKKVTYNIFAQAYYEDRDDAVGYEGIIVGDKNRIVTLDVNGTATVSVNLKEISSNTSQLITIQVKATDDKDIEFAGSGDTVVHAGNGYIDFGIIKTDQVRGQETVARLYTKNLDGQPIANKDVQYTFSTSEWNNEEQKDIKKTIKSGIIKTDGSGFGEIRQTLNLPGETTSTVILDVYFADDQKNKIQNTIWFYYYDKLLWDFDPHEAQMQNLDISGTSGKVNVGDTVTLNINSPLATTAMVSIARGRIYKYDTLQLNQGNNSYSFTVDEDFAPSFTVWFMYFHEGKSYYEGIVVRASDSIRTSNVSLSTTKSSYSASESPKLTIATKDSSGATVKSSLIVRVVDEAAFRTRSVLPNNSFLLGWNGYRETTVLLSSSVTGIGYGGGGKCGGHFENDYEALIDREARGLYFNSNVETNNAGEATISLPSKKGTWRVLVYSAASSTQFGSAETTFSVN